MHAGLLALSLLAVTLSAEPAGDEGTRVKVQTSLKQAAELFRSGDYEGALTELKRVDEVQELGGVRFNIARCLEELQRPAEALAAFERYLKTPDGTATAAVNQKRAREAILRLEPQVFGSVAVRCTPEGVQLKIVGVTESPIACGAYPRVQGGTYQVIATLAGFKTLTTELVVEPGQQAQLAIALERQGATPDQPDTKPAARTVGALSISGSPSGSAVAISHAGKTLTGALPWAARDLEPGKYRVEVGRLGERGVARDVQVSAGQETRVQVSLSTAEDEDSGEERKAGSVQVSTVPLDASGAPARGSTPVAAVTASSGSEGMRVGGIVVASAGGAALVVSGILALLGEQKKSQIVNGGLASGADIQAAASSGTALNNGSLAMLGVGVVALGVGTVLLVLSRDSDGSRISLAPTATPGGAGLVACGRFP